LIATVQSGELYDQLAQTGKQVSARKKGRLLKARLGMAYYARKGRKNLPVPKMVERSGATERSFPAKAGS
jgi:hypothetical protein